MLGGRTRFIAGSPVRRFAGALVAVVLIVAAASKAVDPLATTAAMSYVIGMDRWSAWVILNILVSVEWLLGVLLLFDIGGRPVKAATAAILVVFSGYLLTALIKDSPAGCGCGLWWTRRLPTHIEALTGFARNALLLALLYVASTPIRSRGIQEVVP